MCGLQDTIVLTTRNTILLLRGQFIRLLDTSQLTNLILFSRRKGLLGAFYFSCYPVLIGRSRCDERFVGYGGNKAACLFEMYLSGISFYVLADHFIIHQNHLYQETVRKNEVRSVRIHKWKADLTTEKI